MPIITLTTDFGTRDGYVGAVKGVISHLAPGVAIVDIAHDIPRGDIAHAAWVVKTSTLEFPHETIHVVVVDPGVGSTRPAVIARVPPATYFDQQRSMQLYVGPDNGVFAYLPIDKAWDIRMSEVAQNASATFHGRDVFAYAAASLARGHHHAYGASTTLTGTLPWATRSRGHGHIVHIDQYGNLISNLPAAEAGEAIRYDGNSVLPLKRTYSDVAPGMLVAYIGSAGTVEIAVRDGRADTKLDAKRGDLVESFGAPEHNEGPYR